MRGNHDDIDGDSAAESSSLDFRDWRALMAEARRERDAQTAADEAYPRAVDIAEPECIGGRSSSGEIDESEAVDDEDEERRNTSQRVEHAPN